MALEDITQKMIGTSIASCALFGAIKGVAAAGNSPTPNLNIALLAAPTAFGLTGYFAPRGGGFIGMSPPPIVSAGFGLAAGAIIEGVGFVAGYTIGYCALKL